MNPPDVDVQPIEVLSLAPYTPGETRFSDWWFMVCFGIRFGWWF